MRQGDDTLQKREERLSALMLQALGGDAAAYRSLLVESRLLLLPFFSGNLRRLGQREDTLGEDLVQETLLAIHEKRQTYDTSRPYTAWMYAIARYKMIDALRKRRMKFVEDDISECEHILPLQEIKETNSTEELKFLMAGLNPRQREVMILAKIEELPLAEVSRRMGISLALVKVTIHRALKQMRETWDEKENSA